MHISFRIIGILFFLFMGMFFDFRNFEFRFEMPTGVCDNFDYIKEKCISGEELKTVNLIPLFFDLPSIVGVSVVTILGSAFRGNGLIVSLEKASHLAKDAGELGAAIGAIHAFMGVFNEAAISQAFGFVFSAYFVGLSISIICSALANYLRSKKQNTDVETVATIHGGSIAP